MNSTNQGNNQGSGRGSQQGASPGSRQSGADASDVVQVDFDEDVDIADEPFILGEVRRADRVRNRQSTEGQSHQGGRDKADS